MACAILEHMQTATPDWAQVCKNVRSKLIEIIETLDDALETGADPIAAGYEAFEELKLFIEALEQDPTDLSGDYQ